jgi:two-component system sensor histidine kinase RegB
MAFAASPPDVSLDDLDREPPSSILLRWLIGLRWAVFVLLGATLPIGERFLDFHVRYAIALPVIACMAVFNVLAHRRLASGLVHDGGSAGSADSAGSALKPPVTDREVALGVAVDLIAIGALLAASGGAANPLSAVFFVHVALSASLLPARTTFALAALAACLFASLFALPSGACCPNHPANGAFSTHLYGMWLAFVLASGLVAFFLTRVRTALDAHEREIALLRRRADDQSRFASLGTLAAGTAHELATPLGTIAVLAGELQAAPEAAAIVAQVSRCRDILTRMQAGVATPVTDGGSAGQARLRPQAPVNAGASPVPPRAAAGTAARAAVEAAVDTWRRAHPGVLVTVSTDLEPAATVPLSADEIEAALGALLDNALHATGLARSTMTMGGSRASGDLAPISVAVTHDRGAVVVRVEDRGTGVAPHLLGRLGEPFLTSKEPGEGMGLGLYLVRTLLAHVGGGLEVAPNEPQGTRVTLRFAAEAG